MPPRCFTFTAPYSGAPLPFGHATNPLFTVLTGSLGSVRLLSIRLRQGYGGHAGTISALRLPTIICIRSAFRLTFVIRLTVSFAHNSAQSALLRQGLVNPVSLYSGILSERLSVLPSSQETLAPAACAADSHLRPALRPRRNFKSAAFALTLADSHCCPRNLEPQGLPLCGQFRGSITRLGVRCVRFVPASPLTTQHSLLADG